MKSTDKKYGLLTAVTMIVGICIGSGIFFKSDNILISTNGSVFLGVCLFILAAISIIFGCLTMSQLASRTEKAGGLITYAQEFINDKVACSFGWFQMFVYYPTIIVVVSWVIGIYTGILFNLNLNLETQIMIGFAFLVLCFLYNIFTPTIGKFIQNMSTVVKLIPLILLGILGMIYGDPLAGLANMNTSYSFISLGVLSALGPIAYSYDGWIVSTSIAHEVKDAKKTLPRALTIAPLIILVIYVVYFVGISTYVGPENAMALGDQHVSVAAHALLGNGFAKGMTVFVIISVMGTVNGLVTGFIRIPYSLSLRQGMLPFSQYLSHMNERYQIPIYSALFAFCLSAFWMMVHYLTTKFQLLPNSDVSEISISIAYLLYIALYYRVYKLYKAKVIVNKFKGLVCPILATLGSFIILSGGIQNKLFIFYFLFCLIVMLISQWYYQSHKD